MAESRKSQDKRRYHKAKQACKKIIAMAMRTKQSQSGRGSEL